MGIESAYEERMKKWKKIYFFLLLFMLLLFFSVFSNIFGLIHKETPFIMKNCKWKVEKEIFSGKSFTSKSLALQEAKKYFKDYNYTQISLTGEFTKCIGWLAEAKLNESVVAKVMLCRDGWIYVYKQYCKKKGVLDSIKDFLSVLFKVSL